MTVEMGWYLAPPIIAGLLSGLLGFYVLFKHPKDLATHVFFILMMGLTVWMFGEFAMQASGTTDRALQFGKISNLGYLIMPVALLHFTLVYPTIAMPKEKIKLFISALYVPAIIMIVMLVSSNVFFTVGTGDSSYGPDLLIDGDGIGELRGTADGPNGTYRLLTTAEPEYWFYYDLDNDDIFDANESATETLIWQNFGKGLTQRLITGRYGEAQELRKNLSEATNKNLIWWLDSNGTDGLNQTEYDLGEDIYISTNGLKGVQTDNETVIEYEGGNYLYIQGPLYIVLILFFMAVIIIAILNILNRLMKADNARERAQMSYLSGGLIFIIFYILSYYFIGNLVPVRILDGFLTIIIALFFAIAVLKYNLMDIELIIKRSLFYSIIFLVIASIFVVIGEVMEAMIGQVIMGGSDSVIPSMMSAMIVALIFVPMTKQVKRFTYCLFPEARKYEKEFIDRLAAYEATFEAMNADGKISRKESDALKILREKLDLSDSDHAEILDKQFRSSNE
jgi:hypothetical protein